MYSKTMLCPLVCYVYRMYAFPFPPSLSVFGLITLGPVRSVILLAYCSHTAWGARGHWGLGQLDPIERRLNVTNANVLYMTPIS